MRLAEVAVLVVGVLNGATAQRLLIGHVHVAKTGGSTLNGLLANEFEGVCGHKGYSLDIYQAARRLRQGKPQVDSLSLGNEGFHRLRVPQKIMVERGFEDCDYVSNEVDIGFWHQFAHSARPFELHLPCRDPIDHFLSQVNYYGVSKINCTTFVPTKAVLDRHMPMLDGRFRLKHVPHNTTIRCVAFGDQFTVYPQMLNLRKKDRSAVFANFTYGMTNKPRHKESECILHNTSLRKELRSALISMYDYYKFCDECSDWVTGRPPGRRF